jgi:hypothetical protein
MTPYSYEMSSEHEKHPDFWLRWTGFHTHELLRQAHNWRHGGDRWDAVDFGGYLETALTNANNLRATAPRDRLYGLYGVLQGLCGGTLPKVDSALPMPIVWMQGSIGLIRGFRTLDILRNVLNDDRCPYHRSQLLCVTHCQGNKNEEPGPRWTHLWYKDTMKVKLVWNRPVAFLQQSLPRATAWDQQPEVQPPVEASLPDASSLNTRLIIKGQVLSRIAKRSAEPTFLTKMLREKTGPLFAEAVTKTEFFSQMTVVLREWANMCQNVVQDGTNVRILHDLLTWEFTPNVLYSTKRSPKHSLKDFHKWHSILIQFRSQNESTESLTELLRSTESHIELLEVNSEQYHRLLCINARFRCLFVTADDQIGMTWYSAREGDLVVLLCWSRMPAILRPVGQSPLSISSSSTSLRPRYLLIGFAYVEGYMDCGEWNMEENKLVDFVLV